MTEIAVKPSPAEIKRSEGLTPKPVEQPKPIGQPEQKIVNEIQIVTSQPGGNPDQALQDIAVTPKFIREFSKEHSKEGRQQAAKDIRETRGEHFRQKQEVAEQQAKVQEEVSKKELTLAEQRQRLEQLRDEVYRLSGPWFSRLLNYTKLRGLNTDLQTADEAYQRLQQEEAVLRAQEQAVGAQADQLKDAPKLEEGRQKLKSFYKKEKDKWAAAEYTKEDIAKYFTEKHLASLSLEDYALLLKRFPSEMITHVTRQGIRDHVGGDFHTAGLGEYFNNFSQILKDGKLRSRFGTLFKDGLTKDAVAKALDLGGTIKTREDAEAYLGQFMQVGGAGSYADMTAFHTAVEQVADGIYGGERGNEIFFAFPSAHIAAVETTSNDQWIWAKDQESLGINAGLVFIPSEAKVDPKTGSKYELSSDKKPIEHQDRIDAVVQYIESGKFEEVSQEIYSVMNNFPQEQDIRVLQQRLASEFGISDSQVQETLLNYGNWDDLVNSHHRENYILKEERELNSPENTAREVLLKTGALYKEAETTISSKDFWESYFAQHPDQKPKRIIYYEGDNPTKALHSWRESNGITKKAETSDLGFPEKKITGGEDPKSIAGMDRFTSIAEEVIEDYFSQPKAA